MIRKEAKLSSIKLDLLPRLVNMQWAAPAAQSDATIAARAEVAEGGGIADQARAFLGSVSPEWAAAHQSAGDERYCGVYLVGEKQFCMRVNNVQALLDCNREVATYAPGDPLAPFASLVHPSVEQGNKTTVAASCVVGEGSTLGDKSSVKRSVIGSFCKCASLCYQARGCCLHWLTHRCCAGLGRAAR